MKFIDELTRKEFELEIQVSEPTTSPATNLTMQDVWGRIDEQNHRRLDWGMVVHHEGQRSGVFYDILPYKAVEVLVYDEANLHDVMYWLEFVQGANCITKQAVAWKNEDGSKVIALRAEYQCW